MLARKTKEASVVWKGADLERASIVAPEGDLSKEGYLEKLSRSALGGYQKRYFVLKGHYLKYFTGAEAAAKGGAPLGALDVRTLVLEVGSEKSKMARTLSLRKADGEDRFVIRARDGGERNDWLEAVATVQLAERLAARSRAASSWSEERPAAAAAALGDGDGDGGEEAAPRPSGRTGPLESPRASRATLDNRDISSLTADDGSARPSSPTVSTAATAPLPAVAAAAAPHTPAAAAVAPRPRGEAVLKGADADQKVRAVLRAPAPPSHAGPLKKRSSRPPYRWRERHFVAGPGPFLKYYNSPKPGAEIVGAIDVRGVAVAAAGRADLDLILSDGSVKLRAETPARRDAWVAALRGTQAAEAAKAAAASASDDSGPAPRKGLSDPSLSARVAEPVRLRDSSKSREVSADRSRAAPGPPPPAAAAASSSSLAHPACFSVFGC